jgi:hypothetical protein
VVASAVAAAAAAAVAAAAVIPHRYVCGQRWARNATVVVTMNCGCSDCCMP